MAGKISGVALAAVGAGTIFAYAGIKGKSVLVVLQGVIQGKAPASQPQANPITDSSTAQLSDSSTINVAPAGSPPTVTGNYTHAQLQQLWTSAGGSSAAANNAACHAIQESGGNPSVTSANPDGGINVGLWQLDTKGKGAGYSVAQLQNPVLNARLAVQGTRNGTDWSAWATPGC